MNNFSNIKDSNIVNQSFNQKGDSIDKNTETREKSETYGQPLSKDKPKSDNWEKAKTVAVILAFLTAVIGLITKIMAIW